MKCRFCHAELPDGASFCPVCAKSLVDQKETPLPNLYIRKSVRLAVLILIAVSVAGLMLWSRHRPGEYSGGADISYRGWHLLLRNTSADTSHWTTSQETYSRSLMPGTQAAVPLQLYVYDEESEENVAEAFLKDLEKSEIKAVPRPSGEEMECSRPGRNNSFPKAALVSDILFSTDCGTNDIEWSCSMKNGDTIVLHETIEIKALEDRTLTWEEIPLTTSGEVQAAIDSAEAGDALVTLVLAPDTVYEGDLRINEKVVCLTGSEGSVLEGMVSVGTMEPQPVIIENITFEGQGSGIVGTAPFFVQGCTFTGCRTAVCADNGSWPIVYDCAFRSCQAGIRFNSEETRAKSALYSGDSFVENETAVLLERVPGDTKLHFEGCVFEGNGIDIDNRTEVEVVVE